MTSPSVSDTIKVSTGSARGLHPRQLPRARAKLLDPLLFPWGPIKSQTYTFSGSAFSKTSEEKQTATSLEIPERNLRRPRRAAAPRRGRSPRESLRSHKRDRGASGRPRFDKTADVSGDGQVERVLLHDRDLVVFGKGFKAGTGYAYTTLQQFATGSDITDITTRDITGRRQERTHRPGCPPRATRPRALSIARLPVVFQLVNETSERIFAAELARSIGRKRVSGTIRFRGGGIELGPGGAAEWTDKTYPFDQDTGPVGGYEPLLLPWSDSSPVRYRWTGTSFTR